jgi:Na+/melibiose symporter-like transporter
MTGGYIVQALTAPIALLVDVSSYVASAFFLTRVRVDERIGALESSATSVTSQIREGLGFVLGNVYLRGIAASAALGNFFMNGLLAVFFLYAVRTLSLDATLVGLILALGGVGGLAGALATPVAVRRLGVGRTIVGGAALTGIGALVIALASGSSARVVAFLGAGFLVFVLGIPPFNITVISLRQAITPDHLLGRMNATMRFLVWGTMPLGALVGGALGGWVGLRETVFVSGVGMLLPAVIVAASPIRRVREHPAQAAS